MRTKTSVGRDLQDVLLAQLTESEQTTVLYLRNRMSVRGRVLDFDSYVILFDPQDGTSPQLVYKSAVVSIVGPRRFALGPVPRRSGPPRRSAASDEGVASNPE